MTVARFGPWEVTSIVGRGATAQVFRARGPRGEDVAIKLVRDRARRERFAREARLLAELGEREGFVPLLDSGSLPEGLFIVMPFLAGGTLRDRMKRGAFAVDEAVALVAALARALVAAHARNVVHRDLKPENVRFADGRPLMADLGLAKVADAGDISRTGELQGTVGYVPIEQMRDSKRSGPPADVFALGAILYELLAGEPAFRGGTPLEVIERVTAGAFTPLRRLLPDVPPWLDRAVARALAREADRRFPDAATFAAALRPGGGARRVGRAAAVMGAVVIVSGLAGVASRLTDPRAAPAAPPPAPAPALAPPAPPRAAAVPTFPDELASVSSGNGITIRGVLGSLAFRTSSPIRAPSQSADRTRIALLDDDRLRVFDAPSGALVAALPAPASTAIALSSDGRHLAFAEGDVARIVGVGGHGLDARLQHPARMTALAWLHDGATLVAGCANGDVAFSDVARDRRTREFRPRVAAPPGVATLTRTAESWSATR